MSIHEHLPRQIRHELKQVGWSKATELVKVARSDPQYFDCATWLHKAESLPKEQFKAEVERELTGRESESSELMYFKLYKSQVPVVEQALDTAARIFWPGLMQEMAMRRSCFFPSCACFDFYRKLRNENFLFKFRHKTSVSRLRPKTPRLRLKTEVLPVPSTGGTAP